MIDKIGEAAGLIWKALEGKGEGVTIAQLKSETKLPNDLLHQGLGWLAREDKLQLYGEGKSHRVSLK